MPKKYIREHTPKLLEQTQTVERSVLDTLLSKDQKQVKDSEVALTNFLGLPKDLPSMANVDSSSLNGTIGLITRSAGMLNMSNPLMQTAGLLGLAYAVKPGMVKGFLGTSTAANVIGGLAAYQFGGMAGGMLSSSATLGGLAGAATGYAIASALSMSIPIIGAGLGFIGGIFGGHARRKAKRAARDRAWSAVMQQRENLARLQDQKQIQSAAMEDFLAHADLAMKSLLQGKEFIDFQRERLVKQRDRNIGIIASNIQEAQRVTDLKNEAIKLETTKTIGRQMVQIGNRGISDAGSSWFITGETEAMGTKAQQELRLSFESILDKEAIKYQTLLEDYEDGAKELDYANQKVDLEAAGLKSSIQKTKTQFDINMRAIERNSKLVERNIQSAERAFYGNGGRGSFSSIHRLARSVKDFSMADSQERKAESMAAISFGNAISSTKAGVNPFDALLNYNMF